jgi:hypothetical protein
MLRSRLAIHSSRHRSPTQIAAGLLAVVALALGALVVPDVASPVYADGDRSSGVSSRTGIQYWGNFNCVGQRPIFSWIEPAAEAEIQIAHIEPGSDELAVSRIAQPFDPRFGPAPGPQVTGFAGQNRTYPDGTVFILRDRRPGQATYQEVLRFGPSDCQDYDGGGVRGAYRSIDPTRALDTRPSERTNHTGARPAAGQSVVITPAMQPDRPDSVIAVAVTVTMAGAAGRGFAQVYPTGAVTPGATANVNVSGPGGAVGNFAVSTVGDDGSISVFTSVATHLIVDVVGYFVDTSSPSASDAGLFESRAPIRMLDTRSSERVNFSGSKPGARSTTTLDLRALDSGLPEDATAAVVNVSALDANAQGFIQAAAGGTLVAGESAVVNLGPGQASGGLTIVPVSPEGTIDLYTSAGANLIVDLSGWFVPGTGTSGAYVPLQPERVTDTRGAAATTNVYWNGYFRGNRYNSAIPIHAVVERASAVLINATVISPDSRGFVQITDSSPDLSTSNVNFSAPGSVTANAGVIPVDRSNHLFLGWPFGTPLREVRATIDISGYFTT